MKTSRSCWSIAVAAFLLLPFSVPGFAANLVPPTGYYAAVGHNAAGFSCPSVPKPYTTTLDFPSKYEGSGAARDQVNPEADAEYKSMTKPITDFERGVGKLVDGYMEDGQPAELQCVLGWMTLWASAHALEQDAADHTGKSMRKWALGSIAGSYVRLKFSRSEPLSGNAQQAQQIEAWLGRVADHLPGEWKLSDPKVNNHYYWAAWAAMATAVADNRHDLFDWSISVFRCFEGQLDSNGYLPNELARDTRALGYHAYALTPLTMIAAFGRANGIDLAHEGNGALGRLASTVVQGSDNPAAFEAKTGHKQNLEGVEGGSKWAWLEPYCWTVTCNSEFMRKLNEARPADAYRLGGDLTALFGGGTR